MTSAQLYDTIGTTYTATAAHRAADCCEVWVHSGAPEPY